MSGLNRRSRKAMYGKPYREFESHSLRRAERVPRHDGFGGPARDLVAGNPTLSDYLFGKHV